MFNRTVQSKLETLLFSGNDEDSENFDECFDARLHLLKLRTVPLDQENLPEEKMRFSLVSKTSWKKTVRNLVWTGPMSRKKDIEFSKNSET